MPKSILIVLLLACTCILPACTGVRFPIDHRDLATEHVDDIYRHELDYIVARRQAVAEFLAKHHPEAAKEVTPAYHTRAIMGLAFSGGGLRSATFNLGVMQALERSNRLHAFDYLSTVSGGSYIGSWYVAHCLLNGEQDKLDDHGVMVSSADPRKLLLNPSGTGGELWQGADPVMHLRGNSSFFFDESGMGAVKVVGWYLLLWAPNFLTDFVFHYKPTRGKWNWYHMFYRYQNVIEKTYLMPPTGETAGYKLKEINPRGSKAPYLIINATLANCMKGKLPFEFTRDYVGGGGIGYVPVDGFDKEVHDVKRVNGRAVETEVFMRPWNMFPKTKDFKLATAVTASGAAIDSGGTPFRPIAEPFVRFLNLNMRYETRNFAQKYSQWYWRWWDRFREITYERWFISLGSNTLFISDGGHYDNLGVSALVRRRAEVIVAFDATADRQFKYKSLHQSQKRVAQETCGNTYCLGMKWKMSPQPIPGLPPKAYVTPGTVSCSCKKPKQAANIKVYYCKLATLLDDPKLPRYVRHYLNRSKTLGDHFPYTSTARQWYNWTEFEAYRQLGYHIGKEALKHAKIDKLQYKSKRQLIKKSAPAPNP